MGSEASKALPAARRGSRFGLALWACWLYVLIAVGRINELIPGLGAIPLAKVAVLIWILALLAEYKDSPRPKLLQFPFYKTALFLTLLAYASILFSVWQGSSLAFLVGPGAVLVITSFLFAKTLNTWERIRASCVCFVIAGFGLALQGARGYAGGRLVVQSMYDPNDLAYMLCTTLPFAVALAALSRGRVRLVYLGACLLMVAVILLTQSRGGFVALLAMGIALLRILGKRKKLATASGKKGLRTGPIIIAGILGFGAIWMVLPQETRDRISSITSLGTDYNTNVQNRTGRMSLWTRNLEGLIGRPWGFGVAAQAMADLRSGGTFKAIHNTPLQFAVELGFLGLFLFLRLYWLLWRELRKLAAANRTPPITNEQRALIDALSLSMVGNLVAGFFLSMAYSNVLWVLVSLAAVTIMIIAGAPPPTGRRVARSTAS
jgi:O-antigen ligase